MFSTPEETYKDLIEEYFRRFNVAPNIRREVFGNSPILEKDPLKIIDFFRSQMQGKEEKYDKKYLKFIEKLTTFIQNPGVQNTSVAIDPNNEDNKKESKQNSDKKLAALRRFSYVNDENGEFIKKENKILQDYNNRMKSELKYKKKDDDYFTTQNFKNFFQSYDFTPSKSVPNLHNTNTSEEAKNKTTKKGNSVLKAGVLPKLNQSISSIDSSNEIKVINCDKDNYVNSKENSGAILIGKETHLN